MMIVEERVNEHRRRDVQHVELKWGFFVVQTRCLDYSESWTV